MVGFLLKGNKLDHEKLEVPRVNRPHTKHHSLIEHILVHTNVGEWLQSFTQAFKCNPMIKCSVWKNVFGFF